MDPKFRRWTKAEDEILLAKKRARCMTREIAVHFGRSRAAVAERYFRLCQKYGRPTGLRSSSWTDQDDETLFEMKMARHYNREIAAKLGRTDEAIDARWKKVRIKKGIPLQSRSRKKQKVSAIITQAPPSSAPSRAVRHSTLLMDAELRARIQIQGPNGLLGDPLPGRSALDRRVIEDSIRAHAGSLNQILLTEPENAP